jgi:c(7)-type cytochrome triheme protein
MRPIDAMRVLLAAAAWVATAAWAQEGKAAYDQQCAVCHASGLAGAPRRGHAADWAPRLKAGREALYRSALQGKPPAMPARGGNPALSDATVRAAVDHLLAGSAPPAAAAAQPRSAREKPAAAPSPAAAPPSVVPAAVVPAAVVPAAVVPAAVVVPPPGAGAAESNAFNRLLKPMGKRNLPPTEDGIHDAANDGTQQLQPPLTAFSAMPRATAGNRVDWVKALEQKKIAPRWERDKPDAQASVMDLNIVREVKGSMPDVVYPHKQHTEWLDCANCHPAIFVPQKGANAMSMASILLGQGCGACHGRVAFPVSECRLCHSRKKDGPAPASHTAQAEGGKP